MTKRRLSSQQFCVNRLEYRLGFYKVVNNFQVVRFTQSMSMKIERLCNNNLYTHIRRHMTQLIMTLK